MTNTMIINVNAHIQEKPAESVVELHHYAKVCGMVPVKRRQGNHSSTLNELNQQSNGSSLTSIPVTPAPQNFTNTVPKQVVDIVDMANSVDNVCKGYRRQLELDIFKYFSSKASDMSPTQIFTNIEIDGVLVQGKQDTWAGINAMPLNVYGQLNLKLQEKLQL